MILRIIIFCTNALYAARKVFICGLHFFAIWYFVLSSHEKIKKITSHIQHLLSRQGVTWEKKRGWYLKYVHIGCGVYLFVILTFVCACFYSVVCVYLFVLYCTCMSLFVCIFVSIGVCINCVFKCGYVCFSSGFLRVCVSLCVWLYTRVCFRVTMCSCVPCVCVWCLYMCVFALPAMLW